MKKLLTAGIIGIMVSSCGLKSECGKDVKMACNLFMGYDPVSQVMVDKLDKEVKDLIKETDLQGKINDLVADRLAALELKSDLLSGFLDSILNDDLSDEDRSALNSIIIVLNDYGDRLAAIEGNNATDDELEALRDDVQMIVDSLSLVQGPIGLTGEKGDTGSVESTFMIGSDCVEIVKHGVNFDFVLCK